jgi:chromosome segregation ATPase
MSIDRTVDEHNEFARKAAPLREHVAELAAALAEAVREREDYNGAHQLACLRIEELEAEVKRLRLALDMILATGDLEPNRPLDDCRRYARKALMEKWPPA